MISILRSEDRGRTQVSWLDSYHSFSFGEYHNPKLMGFRSLRVINEDFVAPGHGFDMHPHRNMEIITVMLRGQIQHRDSMGHEEILNAGDVQYMSAGRGVLHSEINPNPKEPTHLIQIWIMPNQSGLTPRYESRRLSSSGEVIIASPDGREGSISIQQDATVSSVLLNPSDQKHLEVLSNRGLWLHLIDGELTVDNQHQLTTGDSLAVECDAGVQKLDIRLSAVTTSRLLMFDLA